MLYSERFIKVLDELGITSYALEKKYGIKGAIQAISNYKSENNSIDKVSLNVVFSFLEKFDNVNANYIIRGKGQMFNDDMYVPSKDVIVGAIEGLIEQIDSKDDKIKELENELAKKAL